MLSDKGFDLWADGYDAAVGVSDGENSYPFAGYKEILGRIYRIILNREAPAVLDAGFGTGTLTARLYESGCQVYGQDFSARMIELAQQKMPGARLYRGDLAQGFVPELQRQTYDFIVGTYSLHHLTDGQKVVWLREALALLRPEGMILIGDVAFETREQLEACRLRAGEEWDDEEIYFVCSELRREFPALQFEQVSGCAGLITLTK